MVKRLHCSTGWLHEAGDEPLNSWLYICIYLNQNLERGPRNYALKMIEIQQLTADSRMENFPGTNDLIKQKGRVWYSTIRLQSFVLIPCRRLTKYGGLSYCRRI
jgi:hypothetical protein